MIWLGLAAVAFLSVVVFTLVNGIGPVPTSRAVLKTVAQLVPPFEDGVDLGSGWGGLALQVGSSGKMTGFETSPLPYLYSRFRLKALKSPRWCVHPRNFFKQDLSRYDLVVCYLYPKAMTKLSRKLNDELAPDAHVISHTFALPQWTPVRTLYADDLYRTPVYLYRVGSLKS